MNPFYSCHTREEVYDGKIKFSMLFRCKYAPTRSLCTEFEYDSPVRALDLHVKS